MPNSGRRAKSPDAPTRAGSCAEWAPQKLTTSGEVRRAILRETLKGTLSWPSGRRQSFPDPASKSYKTGVGLNLQKFSY